MFTDILKCTLGQVKAIHNANYAHDEKANQLFDKLERSYGFDRGAVITLLDENFADYCDHTEKLD